MWLQSVGFCENQYEMEGKSMSAGFKKKHSTTNCFDYEKDDMSMSVVGRLKSRLSFWEHIGCSEYILSVLEKGYVIPIKGEVKWAYLRNRSTREEPIFVQQSMDELLDSGAIVECTEPPLVVNPLTVSKKADKLRLAIGLRHINDQLVQTKGKYEGMDTAQENK